MLKINKKLRDRVLSSILVIASVISLLPMQVFSVGQDNPEGNQNVSASVEAYTVELTLDGAPADTLLLHPYEKRELLAQGAPEKAVYQWQILHPKQDNLWVNIYDAIGPSLSVTKALVGNMLTEDQTAQLRCRVTVGQNQQYSQTLTVVMGDAAPEVVVLEADLTEVGEVATFTGTPAAPDSFQKVNSDATLLAEGEGVSEFVTVTIDYARYDYVLQADGVTMKQEKVGDAFTPYVAKLKSGSDLSTVVSCPTIVGYDAYLVTEKDGVKTETKCTEVRIQLTNIQQDVTYTVNYRPAQVSYSVRYFFQNIYDDLYVEDPEMVKNELGVTSYPVKTMGETGTNPDITFTQKEFDGFTSLYYEPEKIAADGSTEFYVYYERDYVLMEFNCNGGYGTDTLYVRYGTYISVPDPVRSGWVFAGWNQGYIQLDGEGNPLEDAEGRVIIKYGDPPANMNDFVGADLPDTMPFENSYYRAEWRQANTTYSVAYWTINDDGSRTYLGGRTLPAITGTPVSGTCNLDNGTFHICGMEAHSHSDACYVCGKTVHVHSQACFSKTLDTNLPGENGEAAIKAHDDGDPEPGYIYVVQVANGNRWPKLYLEDADGNGTYYTVGDIGRWDPATVDDIESIVVGGPVKDPVTGTYGTETLTVTKYKAKTTCNLEHHVHGSVCRVCREHTHSADCYQNERHLEEVTTKVTFVKDGAVVREKKADDPDTLEVVAEYENSANVEVQGDGSTVVNTYYRYKKYTLKFYYAASDTTTVGATTTTTYKIIGGTSYYFGGQHSIDSNYNKYNNYSTMDLLNRVFGGGKDRVGHVEQGSVPTLNAEGQSRLTNGIYTQGSDYDSTSKRTYYYISFQARYNDDISQKWPVNVFQPVTMANGYTTSNSATGAWKTNRQATVSAWNGEHHVWYSKNVSNETIKGKYQQLDYKLLYDTQFADSTTVSFVCFWENGAVTSWNVPRLFRYNIWVEALNSEVKKDSNGNPVMDGSGNPVHVDGTTPMKLYKGLIYKRLEVYDTCDDSDLGGQQHPSLIGFTPNGKDEDALQGVTTVTDPERQFNTNQYASGNNFHFFYTRDNYALRFWNHNNWLGEGKGAGNEGEGGGVKYDTPLSIFGNYLTPAYMAQKKNYPSGLEPNAYKFRGWYTSPGCLEGTEVDWSETMPDADLTLYAKWDPIIHDVYFYYDYAKYDAALKAADADKEQYYWYHTEGGVQVPASYPIKVPHGSLLGTAYSNNPEQKPGYTFVGWFYIDETGKKRFAPDTMEVKKPLHLFAEWQSSIDTQYEVRYVLDSDGTPIASPTTGHLTAGKTKTFIAKAGPELYGAYQDKSLFPLTNSHSILMAEDETENRFTFRYVEDDKVYYRVKYINKVTGLPMCDDKIAVSTYAIVTEKFIAFDGFIPDNYYVRKVLAYDGSATEPTEQNEIIFFYTPDDKHGPFVIEYYTPVLGASQNQLYDAAGYPILTDGDGNASPYWYLQQSEVGTADKGQTKTEDIEDNKFAGFAYNMATVTTYDSSGNPNVTKIGKGVDSVSGTVTKDGLEIRIFYERQSYDYVIEFVEYGTGDILGYGQLNANGSIKYHDTNNPVFSGVDAYKFPFGSTIRYTAPDTLQTKVAGETRNYIFYATTEKPKTQEWTIRASNTLVDYDPSTRTENVLTFYYQLRTVEISYEAVCTVEGIANFGVVDLNYEKAASALTLSGSNAIAADGFAFKGWFADAACTIPVDSSWRFDPGATNSKDDDVPRPDGTKLKPQSLPDVDKVVYYALFEPVKENIRIIKDGENLGNDTFLFRLTGKDVLNNQINLIVSIQGEDSVTIKDLYCGSYTITELTDWSWTYTCSSAVTQNVKLSTEDKDGEGNLLNPQITTYDVTFNNEANHVDWLHGESVAKENQFKVVPMS